MKLDVYLGNEKTGSLFSTDNRGVVFAYDEQYLSNPAAKKLSVSLPLRKQEFSQKECIPFFSGLLPVYDAVSTTIYPGLSDKLSMKIGKQYEIKKVSKNDFFQMAQELDLNPSAIYSVFDAFATKLDDAFDKLLEDKKVNADIASQLKSGIKERMDI